MSVYEIATLHLKFAGAAGAPEAAARFVTEPEAKGRLLGCWRPEYGVVNRLLILRSFADITELHAERVRTRMHTDPFYCSEVVSTMSLDSYAPFPGFESIAVGDFGPIYEVRTYGVTPSGLEKLTPGWAAIAPERNQISKLLLVLYALDGTNRMIHICPYASHAERAAVRDRLPKELKGWPPASGLTTFDPANMQSEILIPTPQSPLR